MEGDRGAREDRLGPRAGRWAIAVVAALVVLHHLVTLFTESINWDELALFRRAADTVDSGMLRGGGRPGLAVLGLVPLVEGCTDPIRVALIARGAWALLTVAYVAGLFELLRRVLRGAGAMAWHAAALGAAMLVLVPVFLRWSLQVRTDQVALACATWAGVALVASRGRARWAAAAGALLAVGFLSTQKVVYVGALVAVLAAGAQWLERDLVPRRELARALALAAGAAAVLAAFYGLLPLLYDRQPAVGWDTQMNTFAFYRRTLGYHAYAGMVPTLAPHMLAGGLLVVATFARIRRADSRRRLLLAWCAIALGVAVGLFHAAAFPYFWMTIGVFPAAAIALALPDIAGLLPTARARRALLAGLWLLLIVPAVPPALALLRDTQAVQRDAIAFVEENFSPHDRGFHPEGALFCRRDPEPLRVMFSAYIYAVYHGEDGDRATDELIDEFRRRPVAFVLESFRLRQFPRRFLAFLRDNYLAYGPGVMVPGHRMAGAAGARRAIRTFVPGLYRWELPAGHGPAAIDVDGRRVEPGQTVRLDLGVHQLVARDPIQVGILVLAVKGPSPAADARFYSDGSLEELVGR